MDTAPENNQQKRTPGKFAYGRIIQLDRLLRSGKLPSLSQLAKKFDVSQRTLERDMELLRDYFGAPLEYDRSKKTYRYSDKNYRLPTITLTQEELVTVLVAERLLRQYTGTPFEPVLQQSFNKLVAMLPEESCVSVDVANLCKAVVFEQGVPIREYSLQVFDTILDAIIKRRRLEIAYFTLHGNREEGTRFIDPYHIANWGGEWIVIGLCMRRRAIANFHLSRIQEAFALDLYFDRPPDFDAQKYLAQNLNSIAGDDRELVRFRVLPAAATWVKEKVWHFTQKFDKLEEDGSVVLRMEVPRSKKDRESLRRWLLQFGEEAEVLEPAWLRKEILEKIQKAAQNYNDK